MCRFLGETFSWEWFLTESEKVSLWFHQCANSSSRLQLEKNPEEVHRIQEMINRKCFLKANIEVVVNFILSGECDLSFHQGVDSMFRVKYVKYAFREELSKSEAMFSFLFVFNQTEIKL
uniref:Uncharacterized protein n=1 Tax=Nothobranchius furzeri TaxID=105023 RepID=A0A1A8U9L9_NOTFU